MPRGLFIQPASGAAGDMFLAALLDLGLDLDALRAALEATALSPFRLETRSVTQGALRATKLDVHVRRADGREVQEGRDAPKTADQPEGEAAPHSHHDPHDHHGHSWRGIDARIAAAPMPERARERARSLFRTLAAAEARSHGVAPEDVHFHEVGARDSILDICGAAIALELLDIDEVRCDRIGVGQGTRRTAHGSLPVPTPATAEILRGLPLFSTGVADEMVTPTGAAILRGLTDAFEPPEPHRILATGYGSGTTRRADPPNVLRVTLYATDAAPGDGARDEVLVLETALDDMTGEALGFLRQRLEAVGALDVTFAAIQMKKDRPGTLLTALVRPEDEEKVGGILFRESSTFGYRRRRSERRVLDRRIVTVESPWGPVRVKEGLLGREVLRREPEHEALARIAVETGRPLREITDELRGFLRSDSASDQQDQR